MIEFVFVRPCLSHFVSLFRSVHLNTFIALCGSTDTTFDREVSHIVSVDIFAEEKSIGLRNLSPLPIEVMGSKVEIHEYFAKASPRSVTWPTLRREK